MLLIIDERLAQKIHVSESGKLRKYLTFVYM